MKEDTINRILAARQGPFLSILLPMHKTGRERQQNQNTFDKAIQLANTSLKRKVQDAQSLIDQLNRVRHAFDPLKTSDSIGIFVSPTLAELISFPFDVTKRIIIDDTFETRDLLFLQQYLAPYYISTINGRFVRLFYAQGPHLTEIRDGVFPLEHIEEREYERSAIGSSYGYGHKAYEKDKSSMTKLRIESFYREAIAHLQSYLRNKDKPLVIAGTREDLSLFVSLNDIKDQIAASVFGIFKEVGFEKLGNKAWASLRAFRDKQVLNLIHRFKEKDTPQRVAKGIQEVWRAATEGRGKLLLVERDFRCRSFLKDGDPALYLGAPKGKHVIVPDAVDEIIETVMEKGGEVLFTEQHSLKDFESIALELRF